MREGEREISREKSVGRSNRVSRTEGSPLPEPSSLSGEKVTLIRKARRDF